jgi:hypothetical protein
MAGPADSSHNAIGAALRDLGWSHSRLMAELRRQARQEGVTLPDTPGLALLLAAGSTTTGSPTSSTGCS